MFSSSLNMESKMKIALIQLYPKVSMPMLCVTSPSTFQLDTRLVEHKCDLVIRSYPKVFCHWGMREW